MTELKKEWNPNPEAFQRLLNWLDGGTDSDGVRYIQLRRRLQAYFLRKNCLSPDELADETLNRIARKLEEKGEIAELSPLHYSYIVARFVFLENLRKSKAIQSGTDELLHSNSTTLHSTPNSDSGLSEFREKRMGCLERCLRNHSPEDRELILEYYRGEQRAKIEHRSALAVRLGLSLNALCIRACRIRNKLQACVKTCLAGK